jgi:hypothetical protein
MKDLSLLISCPGGIHIMQPSFEMQACPLPYARYISTSSLRNLVLQTCLGPSFDGGVHTLMSLRHRTRLRGVSGLIHFVPGATSPTRKVSRGVLVLLHEVNATIQPSAPLYCLFAMKIAIFAPTVPRIPRA